MNGLTMLYGGTMQAKDSFAEMIEYSRDMERV
jgi:hypothetical protein